jgi:hypothetical protein
MIACLMLARKSNKLKFEESGLAVDNIEISYDRLKNALGSLDQSLSINALEVLRNSCSVTAQLTTIEKRLLLFFVENCLKSGNPDYQQNSVVNINHILLRHRISKDPDMEAFVW